MKRGFLLFALLLFSLAESETLRWGEALARLPASPGWLQAELAYEGAVRSLEASQAALLPQLSPQANYNRSAQGKESLGLGVGASVVALPWNPRVDAVENAKRALFRAELVRKEARNNLVLNLASRFYGLYQAELDLEVARAVRGLREAQLEVAKTKQALGQATFQDVLAARQALESARLDEASADGALELARLSLAQALGEKAQDLGVPEPPPETLPPLPSLEQALTEALRQRSDVLQAESRLDDAQAALNAARRDRLLPDANLNLGYSGQEASLGVGLNLKSGTLSFTGSYPLAGGTSAPASWSASLSLGFSLLSPVQDAQIARAETDLAEAKVALEAAKSAATLEVRQRYQEVKTALAQVALSEHAKEGAVRSLAVTKARLKAGTGTALDVQAAEVALLQAKRNLEVARIQAHLAYLKLLGALGRDLIGGTR
jgi:Outer membrane protein